MKNFVTFFVIVVFCLSLLGCSDDPKVDNSAGVEANLSPEANVVVESKPVTNIKPDEDKEAKAVLAKMRLDTDAKINVGSSQKFNIYNVSYSNRPTKKEEAQITIVTVESDVIGVEIKYFDKGKMIRMLLRSGKGISYDNGKAWVAGNGSKAEKCFSGARRTVGKYESNLKVVEAQLEDFLWFDCLSIPKGWLIPLESDFNEDKYESGT